MKKTIPMFVFLIASQLLLAQNVFKGIVVDKATGESLIGVSIYSPQSQRGTVTDIDGAFSIELSNDDKNLELSYVGYANMSIALTSAKTDLGTIALETDAVGLEEVAIIASIVRNDRTTPVPVSNIKAEIITEKLSNQEFPEILKATPSVYVTKGAGGFGDSRINMRGFDSSNLGVLINGVPINGMENGKVYWSNWSGLSDVTQFIQVQRGLGASKLGLSSVGGTMNMVTRGTESKRGGAAYIGVGNDGYFKTSVNVSTGLLDNGWSFSFAGSRTAGDGYVNGTSYEGWTYFGNLSKNINENHKLSLTAFGAPQWHNQRATMNLIEDIKNSPDGARHNQSYGYLNGEEIGGHYGHNTYHKPQVSLNHYWRIDEKSTLSTSLYGSIATGGGRRTYGAGKNKLAIDYTTGRPSAETYMTPAGTLDFDRVYAENSVSTNGSDVIFTNNINDHQWYGLLSSYRNEVAEGLTVTGGLDARYYLGRHTNEITDLLGGEYFAEKSTIYGQADNTPLGIGDLVGYNNTGEILWTGLFAQAEYVKDNWSAFASVSATGVFNRYRNPGDAPINVETGKDDLVNGKQTSDWVNFLPWSGKAGVNYKITNNHSVFFNGGYFTRAPYMNAIFPNYNIIPNADIEKEKIMTFDLGYVMSFKQVDVRVNAYYTNWMDKFMRKTVGTDISANIAGLDAVHYGVELEATYKPTDNFSLRGMFSWGDWTWADDVNFSLFDENQNKIGEYNAYVGGVHVGNSAQMTASLGLSWEFLKGLKLNVDGLYAGKNYADFDPANRTDETSKGVDSWKIPDYFTIDAGLSYNFNISKDVRCAIYSNVNNLTNNTYIADAKDGANHDMSTALVYYGFGTTWSTGLKIMF